jgi:hypothetical protein
VAGSEPNRSGTRGRRGALPAVAGRAFEHPADPPTRLTVKLVDPRFRHAEGDGNVGRSLPLEMTTEDYVALRNGSRSMAALNWSSVRWRSSPGWLSSTHAVDSA